MPASDFGLHNAMSVPCRGRNRFYYFTTFGDSEVPLAEI